MYNTLTLEADIISLLGMTTTTELCRQKCRRIQASSHNQAGIYIRGLGGGRRQYGMVILSSASAVSFRVAGIRKKCLMIFKGSLPTVLGHPMAPY